MAQWEIIKNLDSIVETGRSHETCVILFHGYGADADDLHPLCQYLDPSENYDWYFPQGIIQVILGPGARGRAWFDIDVKALEEAMMKGVFRDLSAVRPNNMSIAVEIAMEFISTIMERYKKVVVGGFSQGAMLAVESFLKLEKKPEGLVVLSGALIDEKTLRAYAKNIDGKKFFMSHGFNDVLLDFKSSEKLFHLLRGAGMEGKFHQFKGGHEIPPIVLNELGKFIISVLE